jgi:hypothetical protein
LELYCIAPEAEWIDIHPLASGFEPPDSPYYFPLLDDQIRTSSAGFEDYRRSVEHVLDASRLEDASLILHELNADCEKLVIHHLKLIRDGIEIDVLNDNIISVLQRESELEKHIINRRHTVSISITDLRVGDMIDYAATQMTSRGDHPVRGRQYHANILLSWGCPVQEQRIRLLNETVTPVDVQENRYRQGRFSQKLSRIPPEESFERIFHDQPLARIDGSAPGWFWPDHLQIASQAEWDALSSRLWSSYQQQQAFTDCSGFDAVFEGVEDDLQQKVLAAIDFVQNQVRYKGESHGIFSHTPRPAEDVLKKRFGDCKDKSNLLRALLQHLGVTAHLVLVSTRRGKVLPRLLPSLFHFDHMIVRLEWQGQEYFIDATIKKQSGDLEHRAHLDFHHGLPLREEGEGLCSIPWDLSRKVYSLRHRFDFSSESEDEFFLDVERCYAYHRADNMRFYIQSNEKARLQQDFLETARESSRLQLETLQAFSIIEDDASANRLITVERYRILGKPGNDANEIDIATDFVNELVHPPAVNHPVHIELEGCLEHRVEVIYREAFDVDEQERIDCTWFNYSDRVTRSGRQIDFLSRLCPLRRQVDEADIPAYVEAMEGMRRRSSNRFVFADAANAPADAAPESPGFWRGFFTDWTNYVMFAALLIWLWSRSG